MGDRTKKKKKNPFETALSSLSPDILLSCSVVIFSADQNELQPDAVTAHHSCEFSGQENPLIETQQSRPVF